MKQINRQDRQGRTDMGLSSRPETGARILCRQEKLLSSLPRPGRSVRGGRPSVLNHFVFALCLCGLCFRLLPAATPAPGRTAEEIIRRVDRNATAGSLQYRARMAISIGGEVRTKEFEGWAEGTEKAYIEFTAPARDRGTRFLKLGDEMWMWLREVGKSTKLSGHMLRQSFAGSDFSYSDAARNTELLEDYDAERVGTDTLDGRALVVVELTAKRPDVDYARRRVWVDTTDFTARRSEMYAASGRRLRTMTVEEVRRIDGRNFPTRVRMVNELRTDTWTELEFTELRLDVRVRPEVFTRGWLER